MASDPTSIPAGAVDAHVHIKDAAGLADAAAAGISAVRDGGTKEGIGLRADRPDMPRVVSAGWALISRGGYGSFMGIPVANRDEIGKEIAKLKTAGAGIIKVVASGMVSLKEPGSITPGGFAAEELYAIVEEADAVGLSVMAHANGEEAIIACARAGVRSVEHGFFMTGQALDALQENGVFWVPTVGALVRAADREDVPAEVKDFIGRTIGEHLAMIGQSWKRGIGLAIGTDCTLPDLRYREAYKDELRYFRQAGIPADGVDRIACDGGAKLLGLTEERTL